MVPEADKRLLSWMVLEVGKNKSTQLAISNMFQN